MSVIEFNSERRRRRSTSAYQAIRFQLQHIFDRRELRNFTLADSRGLILAHAGHTQEAEILAAYAPMLATTVDRLQRRNIMGHIRTFIPDANESSIAVRSFEVDGETLHLCVLGDAAMKQTDIYRAVSGVRRIFTQFTSAA